MSDLTVANTVLQQLGGAGRLSAMIGAKNFVGDVDSLQFQFTAKAKDAIKGVVIRLDPSDTYTVRFWKNLRNPTVVLEVDDVYADSLVDLFEQTTGLYLTFSARRNGRPTFAQQRKLLLDGLEAEGWMLSPRTLKVPHATSPYMDRIRLWFKPQAIYVSTGTSLGDAQSLVEDMRDVPDAETLIRYAQRYA